MKIRDRDREIIALFTNGHMIQMDIALRFNITRQRISQIIKDQIGDEETNELATRNLSEKLAKIRAKKPVNRCKTCDKQINYTSISCWDCSILLRTIRTPEARKEIARIANMNWQANNKERVKANNKAYMQRPEVKIIVAAKAHKRYLKMKENHVEYTEYLEKQKISTRMYRQNIQNGKKT